MATQAQKDAIAELHAFGDSTNTLLEYSNYNIAHRDPYELYHARKAGGQVIFVFDTVMTVGNDGLTWGYKGEPTTTTPFGSLNPNHINNIKIFAVQARNTIASVIFTSEGGHTIVGVKDLEVSFDGGTTFYPYYANSTDASGTHQYDNVDDLVAIKAAIGTTLDATVTVQLKFTLPDITS